jgi:ABC-type nitrate/sulfonate/bicarbonate transport system substrate-binding protein
MANEGSERTARRKSPAGRYAGRPRRTSLVTGCLAAVFALAAATACASSSGSGSSSASGGGTAASSGCTAPSVVNLAAFVGPGVVLSQDVAVAKGYFTSVEQACHTEIKITTYSTPTAMLSGLASGDLQFAVFTASNDILSALRGENLEDVLNLGQGGGGVLVSSPANKSKGTGLAALKNYGAGSTWAITSLNSTANAYCDAMLAAVGVDYSKINYQAVGIAGAGSAVTSGKAQVGYANAVQAGQLVHSGQAYVIANTGGSEAYSVTGLQPALGLQALPSFVSKYPALTQRIIEAELKGLLFIQQNYTNPSAVYNLEPSSYRATTPEATFAAGWAWNAGFFAPVTGLLTEQDINNAGKLMRKYGLIPASSAIPTVKVDPSIVRAAYKALGQAVPTTTVIKKYLDAVPNS